MYLKQYVGSKPLSANAEFSACRIRAWRKIVNSIMKPEKTMPTGSKTDAAVRNVRMIGPACAVCDGN